MILHSVLLVLMLSGDMQGSRSGYDSGAEETKLFNEWLHNTGRFAPYGAQSTGAPLSTMKLATPVSHDIVGLQGSTPEEEDVHVRRTLRPPGKKILVIESETESSSNEEDESADDDIYGSSDEQCDEEDGAPQPKRRKIAPDLSSEQKEWLAKGDNGLWWVARSIGRSRTNQEIKVQKIAEVCRMRFAAGAQYEQDVDSFFNTLVQQRALMNLLNNGSSAEQAAVKEFLRIDAATTWTTATTRNNQYYLNCVIKLKDQVVRYLQVHDK